MQRITAHQSSPNSSQIARQRQGIMGCYRCKDLEQDPHCRINVGVRICGAEDEVQQIDPGHETNPAFNKVDNPLVLGN